MAMKNLISRPQVGDKVKR